MHILVVKSPVPTPQPLTPNPQPLIPRPTGFTLIELLITIMIIAMMASMLLFALFSAQESAKASKTRTLIAKLDAIIKAKWEGYQTRRVPIVIPPGTQPLAAAQMRLNALRDLMRMELPDRWPDVVDDPATWTTVPITRPAVNRAYLRRHAAANAIDSTFPTDTYASAECLYLIVQAAIAEEGDAREVFKADNIGDVDGDTMPEFLDGWGVPIKFLRWAPGFQESELQIVLRASATGSSTLNLTGAGLSTATGSYQGGIVIGLTPATNPSPPNLAQPVLFDLSAMARISGYQSSSPNTATATVSTSPPPTYSGNVMIMAPDPFDPTGVHPPGGASFALYPLIFSSGPNKCSGIYVGPGSHQVASATVLLNPFYSLTDSSVTPPVTVMIGAARNDSAESNYVPNASLDNIHNHLIGQK